MHAITIKQEAITLKESGDRYLGGFGGRIGKKCHGYILKHKTEREKGNNENIPKAGSKELGESR